MFSRRWATDEVPGISKMFGDCCSSQDWATAIEVAPSRLATASDCSGEKPPSGKYGTYGMCCSALPLQSGRLQPVTGDPQPGVRSDCSCRDPRCGQPAKHPLGSLVPHGVNDATCNRARALAWWTRHPQANIGLATGHRFDVLDVDGPVGAHAIRELVATHDLQSSGPLVRIGGGGWHYYLAPTGLGNVQPQGLAQVDWRGRGGYVVAPPSRHASGQAYQWVIGRSLGTPLPEVPAPLRARLERRSPRRSVGPVELVATGVDPGDRYAQAALTQELARVATAPVGHRNRQLWESTRNLYNLVATGVLDHREVDQRPPSAAGCSVRNPARPAAPWPRAARSAWPTRPPTTTHQPRTHPPLADPACSSGRRADQGEGVMAMAGAGHPAG
jgi:hypothetical protein